MVWISFSGASSLYREHLALFISQWSCRRQYGNLSPHLLGPLLLSPHLSFTLLAPLFKHTVCALNTAMNKKSPRLHLSLGCFASKAEFKNSIKGGQRATWQPQKASSKGKMKRWNGKKQKVAYFIIKQHKKKSPQKVRIKLKVKEIFKPTRLSSVHYLSFFMSF